MATNRKDLEAAFVAADDAGNAEDAAAFADALRAMGPETPAYDYAAHTGTIAPVRKVPQGEGWFGSQYEPAVPKMISEGVPALVDDIKAPGQILSGERPMTMDEMNSHARGIVGATIGAPGVEAVASKAAQVAVPEIKAAVGALKTEAAPTRAAIKAASQGAYRTMDESGIRISPESFQNFADGLQSKLSGFNAKLKSRAPETHALLNDLRNYANEEDTLKFGELADLRSEIGAAGATASKNDKRLISQIKDHVNEYIENLSPDDLDSAHDGADLEAVKSALNKGRDLWRKNALMSDIEDIGNVAKNKEGGKDIAYIQRKFSQLLEKPERLRSFTPEEQGIIKEIANTSKPEKVARFLSPASGLMGLLHGGAGYLAGLMVTGGNPVGAVAVPTAALAARGAYSVARKAKLNTLKDLIATEGAPAAPSYIQRLQAERARLRGQP